MTPAAGAGDGLTADGGNPPMTDEDPWKGWYQKPSAAQPGADETQDMTINSRMPAPGGPGSDAPRREWPQQPPRSSAGGGSYRGGGNGGYGGDPSYGQTVGYGGGRGDSGNGGY